MGIFEHRGLRTCTWKTVPLAFMFLLFVLSINAQKEVTEKPFLLVLMHAMVNFWFHSPKLLIFEDVYPSGIEVEFSQLNLSDRIKNEYGIYSKVGASFAYFDFQHPDLGYSVNAVGYLEPFVKARGKFRSSFRIGGGVAYLSKPYNAESNNTNLSYSTNMAFPLVAGLNGYYFISNQWALKGVFAFRHMSNGGIKKPNLGINYPTLSLGVEYSPHHYKITPIHTLETYLEKERRTEILFGYSQKEDTIDNSQVLMGLLNHSIRVSRRNALTVGAMIECMKVSRDKESADQWSVAPLVGNEFFIGSFRFGQQLGVYLLQGDRAPNMMFQNYYLRYVINKRMLLGIDLKAHGRVADYLALQLGWVL